MRGRNGPSSAGPAEASSAQTTESTPLNDASRSSRGSRGRRGTKQSSRGSGIRGGAAPRPTAQRAFGGRLTSNIEAEEASIALELSGDAPEFVPGQPVITRR